MKAFPMEVNTTETVAITFASSWIAQFRCISGDRRHQFESQLCMHLRQLLGCKHFCTTSHHPITNGIIERLYQQLKAALKEHTATIHCTEALALALLGIRTDMEDCKFVMRRKLRGFKKPLHETPVYGQTYQFSDSAHRQAT